MAEASKIAAGEQQDGGQPPGDAGTFQALAQAVFSAPPGPEFFWVEGPELKAQQIEHQVLLSAKIQREILQTGRGLTRETPFQLPKQVNSEMLSLIREYCLFHLAPGRSDKERKQYNEKFVRMETQRLCHLTSAADALEIQPLVDIASRALARVMEGKSAEEIREAFHLADDLTEEEKLEPLTNTKDDPRIRLLNRLYAKKRKELAERKTSKAASQASNSRVDDRPLEELLSFIEDGAGGKNRKGGGGKNKKKGKSKGKGKQFSSEAAASSPTTSHTRQGEHHKKSASGGGSRHLEDSLLDRLFPEDGFDDDAELDMEAREFAERLSQEWEEKVAERLAMAQARIASSDGPTDRATETAEQPAVCLRNVVEAENLQFDRDGHGAVSSSMADSLDCGALTTSEQPSTVGDWYAEPSTEVHATGSPPPRETQGRCPVSAGQQAEGDVRAGEKQSRSLTSGSRMDLSAGTTDGSCGAGGEMERSVQPPALTDSDAQVALLALQDYLDSSGLGAHLTVVRKQARESASGCGTGSSLTQQLSKWATETSIHLPSGGVMTLVFQPCNQLR